MQIYGFYLKEKNDFEYSGLYTEWKVPEHLALDSPELEKQIAEAGNEIGFIFPVFDVADSHDVALIERVGKLLEKQDTPSVVMALNVPLLDKKTWETMNASLCKAFDAVVDVSKVCAAGHATTSEGVAAVIEGIGHMLERPGLVGLDYSDVCSLVRAAGNMYVGWGYMSTDKSDDVRRTKTAAGIALSMISAQLPTDNPKKVRHAKTVKEIIDATIAAKVGDVGEIRRVLFCAEDNSPTTALVDVFESVDMVDKIMDDAQIVLSVRVEDSLPSRIIMLASTNPLPELS